MVDGITDDETSFIRHQRWHKVCCLSFSPPGGRDSAHEVIHAARGPWLQARELWGQIHFLNAQRWHSTNIGDDPLHSFTNNCQCYGTNITNVRLIYHKNVEFNRVR